MEVFDDVSIFIITKDNDCIVSDEYDYRFDTLPEFIMMTNEYLNSEYNVNDNTIYLHIDYLLEINRENDLNRHNNLKRKKYSKKRRDAGFYYESPSDKFLWQADDNEVPDIEPMPMLSLAIADFDGYKHTMDYIMLAPLMFIKHNDPDMESFAFSASIDKPEQMFPACFVAYQTIVSFNDKQYHGFVPSMGQLRLIAIHQDEMNSIVRNQENRIRLYNGMFWSSSSFHKVTMWMLCSDGRISNGYKEQLNKVLPIFH